MSRRKVDEVYEIVRRTWFEHVSERQMSEQTLRRLVGLVVRFKEHIQVPGSGYCQPDEIGNHRERMLAGPGVFADEPEELIRYWRWFS